MADLTGLPIPDSVKTLVEMYPFEDIALTLLRERFPDMHIVSTIPFDQTAPQLIDQHNTFVLARRIPSWGLWSGDARFVDSGGLSIHVFTKDPDADEKGALISEAIRVALRDAAREARYLPGLGGLIEARLIEAPIRKTDWATSSGPVQFADLPTGYWRYETQYQLKIRRPIFG